MIKHYMMWKLKDDVDNVDQVKLEIKQGLEGLVGKIPGLIEARVITEGISTSHADFMVISSFVDEKAIRAYKESPLHMDVVLNKIRPYTIDKLSLDFEEKN